MPKARVNSTTVSLTEQELKRFDDLYRISFGSSYNPDKTQKKLAKALERIKDNQQRREFWKERNAEVRRNREAQG